MERLLNILINRAWLAVILVIGFAFIPYSFWLSAIFASLFTLAHDFRRSWMMLPALVIPEMVISSWHNHTIVWFIPLNLGFIWFAAWVLHRYRSWSDVFNLATLVLVAVIPFMYWLNPHMQMMWAAFWNWLINTLGSFIHASLPTFYNLGLPSSHVETTWLSGVDYLESPAIKTLLPKVSTGIMVLSYMLCNLMLLLIARAIYLQDVGNREIGRELHGIKLHIAATLALMLVLVCPINWLAYRMDLICALGGLFFLAGLSLAHWLAHWRGKAWMSLVLIYGMLTLIPKTMGLFLIMLACMDSIIDVRKRLMTMNVKR